MKNLTVLLLATLLVIFGYRAYVLSPATPASRMSEAEWAARHRMKLAAPDRQGVHLAIVGDSIIQNLEADKDVWDKEFGPYHPLGLGFGGDTTANVLWRLQNGELDGFPLRPSYC